MGFNMGGLAELSEGIPMSDRLDAERRYENQTGHDTQCGGTEVAGDGWELCFDA